MGVIDYSKMLTGDIIDAILDCVCTLDLTEPIDPEEYKDLFSLVDELKPRSPDGATRNREPRTLDS